ncbi:ketoacyl-ACP synthase III [Echinicola jeungdonensis]|uniref:3-oxoacyl-ACP synthase III family protein n=1 Tax=Echinicola jeungdonensis TaxID=709343 RepID=A0ABV5J6P5_9BACT|nr:ketoacyl-ACP synthase III [Echinicola jeungdonensis]MDN3670976.1 ketoacyl-ACP synthase III [Echinicola jeungdonensis]
MSENQLYSVIIGTGSYIPSRIIKNEDFLDRKFFNKEGERLKKSNQEIIQKFQEITEIEERRYIEDEYVTSDMAFFAAKEALSSAQLDKEDLDYIIVAHNFGDVNFDNQKTDILPSLGSRVKYKLKIQNPNCIAYDLPFGCPGWVQGLIQANYYIKAGDAKNILVIGAETLSRISDPHDIDSMIYADGAGAVVIQAQDSEEPIGILKHKSRSDTINHAMLLKMGLSYNPDYKDDTLFMKMNGRKLYEYALNTVPGLVKETLDLAGLEISDIKKILIHQANAKMDDAITKRILKFYGQKLDPREIMPMTITKLGNNSVATVPILLDLLNKKKLEDHQLKSQDHILFASVGAGMNVNAVLYKVP